MSNKDTSKDGAELEKWLDQQLTGDWATGKLETELRMAVSTIRDMSSQIPKDYAVQPLMRLIQSEITKAQQQLIDELDEMVFAHKGLNPDKTVIELVETFSKVKRKELDLK